ncbi:MAG: flagellar export protein FliJ [Rubrivivax sp.]
MTQALNTLLDLAVRQRDAALVALQQADAHSSQLLEQARQLATYRSDTRQRNPATNGRSAAIDLLRCHDGFMQRLEQAVTMQQQSLDVAQRRAVALRCDLLARELRVASVRKLMERRLQVALRSGVQREQRQADEAAAQRFSRLPLEAAPV